MTSETKPPVLVVLQLSGGNDYMNSVVPYADGHYYDSRKGTLRVDAEDVLKIDDAVGLHPKMGPLKEIYDQGDMAIVHGVGYPNSPRSHFRSMDIWHTCEPDTVGTEGWVARAIRDLDPEGENPVTGVNIGLSLPRAMVLPGVSVASVADLSTYGLLTSVEQEAQRTQMLQRFSTMYSRAIGTGPVNAYLGQTGLDALSGLRGQAFAYTSGFTLAVFGVAMLAVYFGLNQRLSFTAAGLGLVWYWVLPLPFSLFTELAGRRGTGDYDPVDGLLRILGLPRPAEIDGNVEMFFVSGIAVTAAAVLVIILNAELALAPVRWLGGLLGGIAPAIKTAIAYPVAAKLRTGMTPAMFGLVVFSVVVMAPPNPNFTQAFLSDSADGRFDVPVTVNPNNRIPALRAAPPSAA